MILLCFHSSSIKEGTILTNYRRSKCRVILGKKISSTIITKGNMGIRLKL